MRKKTHFAIFVSFGLKNHEHSKFWKHFHTKQKEMFSFFEKKLPAVFCRNFCCLFFGTFFDAFQEEKTFVLYIKEGKMCFISVSRGIYAKTFLVFFSRGKKEKNKRKENGTLMMLEDVEDQNRNCKKDASFGHGLIR